VAFWRASNLHAACHGCVLFWSAAGAFFVHDRREYAKDSVCQPCIRTLFEPGKEDYSIIVWTNNRKRVDIAPSTKPNTTMNAFTIWTLHAIYGERCTADSMTMHAHSCDWSWLAFGTRLPNGQRRD
jgi:hypothetical protein